MVVGYGAALIVMVMPVAAYASLGDTIANPSQAQGAVVSSTQQAFTVYESKQASYATTVHQYVSNATTKVFAVDWSGPRMPDLKSLLGSYFDSYLAARGQKRPRSLHSMVINTPDLVIEAHGPNGNIQGRAWVPSLVPSGVAVQDVVK